MKKTTQYLVSLFLIVSSFLFLLSACLDKEKFDFDKLSTSMEIEPGIAMPVARLSMSLSDVIDEKQDTLIFDNDNDSLITIVYSEDSLYNISVGDIYSIPEIEIVRDTFVLGELSLSDTDFENTLTLEDLDISVSEEPMEHFPGFSFPPLRDNQLDQTPENFKSADFSNGEIKMNITNNLPVPINGGFSIVLRNATQSQPLATFVFSSPIEPGQTAGTNLIDLTGKTMTDDLQVDFINLEFGEADNIQFNRAVDNIYTQILLTNMEAEAGEAVVSEKTLPLDTNQIDFSESIDQQLQSMKIDEGYIELNVNSYVQAEIDVHLDFPSITKNGQQLKENITLVGSENGTNNNYQIDLSGTQVDFTKGRNPYNMIVVAYELKNREPTEYVKFHKDNSIFISADFEELEYNYVEGYFGQQDIDVDSDIIDLELDFMDNIDGSFTLTNPQFNISVSNYSIGVPVDINLDLTGESSDGEKQKLNFDFPVIETPSEKFTTATTQINVNRDNSSIVDLIALPPNQITYSGFALSNPNGETENNFVTHDGKISVNMQMNVPFELRTDNISLQDTTDLDIDAEITDRVNAAKMYIDYVNEFPLNIDVKLLMTDSITNQVIDSLEFDLLDAAQVDAQGNLTQATESTAVVELTDSQIDNLELANRLVVHASMRTAETPENVGVKILAKSKLDLKIRLKASTNFEIE